MSPHCGAPLRFLSLNADSNHKLSPGVGAQDLRGVLLAQFLLQHDLVCLMECKWQEQHVLTALQKGLPLESELKAALQPWRCVTQTTAMASKTCILYHSERLELLEDIDVPAQVSSVLEQLGCEGSGLPPQTSDVRKRAKELLNRCCAIVLRHKGTPGSSFVALSFHGHHRRVSDPKKCELFRLFVRLVAAIGASRGLPVLFGGDFNLHLRAFLVELQPVMSAAGLKVYECAKNGTKRPLKKLVDYVGVLHPGAVATQTRGHQQLYCGDVQLLQLPGSRDEAERLWHPSTIQRLDDYDAAASKKQAESSARAGRKAQRHIIFWPALAQLMGPAGLFDHDGICAQLPVGQHPAPPEAPLLQPLPATGDAGAPAPTAAAESVTEQIPAAAEEGQVAVERHQSGDSAKVAAHEVKQSRRKAGASARKGPEIKVAEINGRKKSEASTAAHGRPNLNQGLQTTSAVGRNCVAQHSGYPLGLEE